MPRTNLELLTDDLIVKSRSGPPPRAPARRTNPWAFGSVALVLAAFGAVGGGIYGRGLSKLDDLQLDRAAAVWSSATTDSLRAIENEVRVMVDDARVREPLAVPEIDDATLVDLLQELKSASGASIVGIVTPQGKVRVASGADVMRGMDLSGSSLMKPGPKGLSTGTWLFPDRLVAVAVAPVRLGSNVVAYLMLGREIGKGVLSLVEGGTGAFGGIVMQKQLVATTAADQQVSDLLIEAAQLETNTGSTLGGLVVRVLKIQDSAGGRVVLAVPRHQSSSTIGIAQTLWWMPFGFVMIAIGFWFIFDRRGRVMERA